MHILLTEKKKTPRESAICRPEHLRTTEILARDKESNFNYGHKNLLVALGRFSANVVTTSLQRCFDVGPTFFQRFYNMPLFMAISVLLGIIRSKKKNEKFLVVAKSSPYINGKPKLFEAGTMWSASLGPINGVSISHLVRMRYVDTTILTGGSVRENNRRPPNQSLSYQIGTSCSRSYTPHQYHCKVLGTK